MILGRKNHFSGKWFFSGEDGIRTHAPVKTNGFQDRLVMTTSIPLRICCNSHKVSFRSTIIRLSERYKYYHVSTFVSTLF